MTSAPPEPPSAAAPRGEATIADYLALGLSDHCARKAVADRRRPLARSSAKPISSVAKKAFAASGELDSRR
jgi:hypothetical protein